MIERKYLFNSVVQDYAQARPNYPIEMLHDIENITKINHKSKILEIGCGTGQASELFVYHNYDLTAVELGDQMVAYVKDRFVNYANFRVIHSAFEDYVSTQLYDLFFAASAFHWIDPLIGYKKVNSHLKDTGYMVLCWNSKDEAAIKTDILQKLSDIYNECVPELAESRSNNKMIHSHEQRMQQITESGYFTDLIYKSYPYERTCNANEYIQLLGTYSDHIALAQEKKQLLFSRVHELIVKNGNQITIPYEVKTYIARNLK